MSEPVSVETLIDAILALRLEATDCQRKVDRLERELAESKANVLRLDGQRASDEASLLVGRHTWSCAVRLEVAGGFYKDIDGRGLVQLGAPEARPVIHIPWERPVGPVKFGAENEERIRVRSFLYERTLSARTVDGKPIYLFKEVTS